jgi:hypothetical protein
LLSAGLTAAAYAQSTGGNGAPTIAEIETSFRTFLTEYRREIKQRNRDYLSGIHPNLPADMHDLFLDITINMMKFTDENDVEPQIACQEYAACKVTYTQPNDTWAAQQFILHNGAWRWLEQ